MSLGLIGRKVGMTRIFTEEGESIPVTVLEVLPNRVTQIKNTQTDGYSSVQVLLPVLDSRSFRSPRMCLPIIQWAARLPWKFSSLVKRLM
jgi:ribosomal protein L3